jgi:hypothetical protein
MLLGRFHGFIQRFCIFWRCRVIGLINHRDSFLWASGGANSTSKASVKIDYRHIIFAQSKGFGGASVNASLACCAQISVKPGLKTRIKS